MVILHRSQNVSVAHRPMGDVGLGNNLTVKMSVAAEGDFRFEPWLERVKSRLDHRCLFEDEPRFFKQPSTLEAVAAYVAEDLFEQPLPAARWVAVEVSELGRFRCKVEPGSHNLRLSLRHRNLQIEIQGPLDAVTGQVAPREQVLAQIDRVFAEFPVIAGESEAQWCERLFIALKKRIPTLCEATVDLGRHRSVRLA